MIFKIDNQTIPMQYAYFREFGFGKETTEYVTHSYAMTITDDEFIDSFQNYYNEYADDDINYRDAVDELVLELRKYGWPTLSRLIEDHPNLLMKFLLANSYDVVQTIFAKKDVSINHRFVINTVESISINRGNISFFGEAVQLKNED